MAHFKRKRCRYLGKGRRSSRTFVRKRWGFKPIKLPHDWWTLDIPTRELWPDSTGYWWGNSYPRHWDIMYHNRPRRAREKRMAHKVVAGRVDYDEAIWPLSKRPHQYYW